MRSVLLLLLLLPVLGICQYDTVLVNRLNINIYASYPYNNSKWNNWKPTNQTTPQSIANLKWEDGQPATNINITLENSGGLADNGTAYTVTVFPKEVGREMSFSTTKRDLQLSGLDDNHIYDLSLLASRYKSGQKTKFTVQGKSDTVVTHNNYTKASIFQNVRPIGGKIIVTIERANPEYNYLNGFTLTEKKAVLLNRAPIIKLPADTTILYGDTVNYLVAKVEDPDKDQVSVVWEFVSQNRPLIGSASPILELRHYNYEELYKVTATDSKGAQSSAFVKVTWKYEGKRLMFMSNAGIFGKFGFTVDGTPIVVKDAEDRPIPIQILNFDFNK